jgi:hypothetical protein
MLCLSFCDSNTRGVTYEWIVFLLFNILDHDCTSCFVFANPFGKSFENLLQIVKGI